MAKADYDTLIAMADAAGMKGIVFTVFAQELEAYGDRRYIDGYDSGEAQGYSSGYESASAYYDALYDQD